MSWIPVPPIATSDKNLAPTPSFSYPPPTATFGSSPPATTRQPHWPLSYGPKEEIFPENKTPHLQPILDKYQNQIFIGLEYVVEIQLVDSERRGSWYSCRLCERSFQSKDLVTNTTENIIHHLGLASHKLNYLQKHFKVLKEEKLEPPNNVCTLEGIDKLALKIEIYFGRLNVKLVIGEKIYFSNLEKIDKIINEGKHFEENLEFLDFVRKKKKTVNVGKTTLYLSPERREKHAKRQSVSAQDNREKSKQKWKTNLVFRYFSEVPY